MTRSSVIGTSLQVWKESESEKFGEANVAAIYTDYI